jgi:competence protein ComEA
MKMKITFIAVALSSFLAMLPIHAESNLRKPPEKQTLASSNKINLNKADLSSLIGSFKGIGKKRAQAIITYREQHKGFKSIEELAEVKGLGQRFVRIHREELNRVFTVS